MATTAEPPRLLLVSSRAKNIQTMTRSILKHVVMVQYRYEQASPAGIIGLVAHALGDHRVASAALVLHTRQNTLCLCGDYTLSAASAREQHSIREFFVAFAQNFLDFHSGRSRLDILGCSIDQDEQTSINLAMLDWFPDPVDVALAPDLAGPKIKVRRSLVETEIQLGELYFQLDSLIGNEKQGAQTRLQQPTAGYEKIRVVGKGAYGAAVLYRRRDDDTLVILKEINIHEMNSNERHLALNEVAVLAKLEHPNIISYFDSFEEDGILMIEMEYADGGNLSQLLSKRESPLEERVVLLMFQQMTSAVRYMHQNNVLHRDLKTANIFLTKEGLVKVGDFGISKIMSTLTKQANTVLGTPYYISPEMCEGKHYNDKSDIWALGCILYEMACLQKTFEGSNLPALVNKIMKGQYDAVKGNYSADFKALIKDMLNQKAELRPSADTILYERLPKLLARFDTNNAATDIDDDEPYSSADSGYRSRRDRRLRSVLYTFNPVTLRLQPVDLLIRVRLRQVSVSESHVLAVTADRNVYSWGYNRHGQLGLGDSEPRFNPCAIESLNGKSVNRVAAGRDFSVFCTDNGIVMSCGQGQFSGQTAALDCGLVRPKLIDTLLSADVSALAAGPEHVVAVTASGTVLAWGRGTDGRLGTGNEGFHSTPTEVHVEGSHVIRNVRCGVDGTILLSDAGSVLAMGSNQYNKLGLNARPSIFTQRLSRSVPMVERALTPTPIKSISGRVVDACLGPDHTALLLDSGHLYLFGSNHQGQLAQDPKVIEYGYPMVLKSLQDKTIVMMQCGSGFTLVGTSDGSLYFWGTRADPDESFSSKQSHSTGVRDEVSRTRPLETIESSRDNLRSDNSRQSNSRPSLSSTTGLTVEANTDTPQQQVQKTKWGLGRTRNNSGGKTLDSSTQTPVITPTQVLRLDSGTETQQPAKEGSAYQPVTLKLGGIVCDRNEIYVIVDTSAPLPHKRRRRNRTTKGMLIRRVPTQDSNEAISLEPPMAPTVNLATVSDSDDANDTTKLPPWLEKELKDNEVLPYNPPPRRSSLEKQRLVKAAPGAPTRETDGSTSSGSSRTRQQPSRIPTRVRQGGSLPPLAPRRQNLVAMPTSGDSAGSRGTTTSDSVLRLKREKDEAQRRLKHTEMELDVQRREAMRLALEREEQLKREVDRLQTELASRQEKGRRRGSVVLMPETSVGERKVQKSRFCNVL